MKNNTKNLVYGSMLVALSVVGAFINIPGTTIAFDSMPGYFAALFLNPLMGAVVAGMGHMVTALFRGFPFTVPLHIIIAFEMVLCAYIFGILYKKVNKIIALISAIILNGPVSLVITVLFSFIIGLQNGGWALFTALVIPLTIVSAINIVLAYIVYEIIQKRRKQ